MLISSMVGYCFLLLTGQLILMSCTPETELGLTPLGRAASQLVEGKIGQGASKAVRAIEDGLRILNRSPPQSFEKP